MKRKLIVEFTKMNGAGNDFIVIDNRFFHFSDDELTEMARTWCPRRVGIGADGLLAFNNPEDSAHDYRMRYFNADGSKATMCGNGARCLARYARSVEIGGAELVFESDAGLYRARTTDDPADPVRLYVPAARDFKPDVSLQQADRFSGPAHYIWTGTEHLVRMVDDVRSAPVADEGPVLRYDEALRPTGANVNYVEVVRAHRQGGEEAAVRVRTYEKGVEQETLACGTGALAAALVAYYLDAVHDQPVGVYMPGGYLRVGFTPADDGVRDLYLEGPVATVFRGTLEV